MNLNPKYAKRLEKYVKSDKVVINREYIDSELGNLLLLSRIKKANKYPTISALLKDIK